MSDLEPRKPKAWYIGIDQSYTGFGLVVLDDMGNCVEKSLLKFPKMETDGMRLALINDTLWAKFQEYVDSKIPVKMAMEGYAYGKTLNREKLGELGGVVKLVWFLIGGPEPLVVAPTALKAYVTGKGRASKEDMLAGVQKWDSSITNHNIADAYGLAHMLYSN